MSTTTAIPTIVPRDLFPRPEVTTLRIFTTTAVPVLVLLALTLGRKGVPHHYVLVTQLMIASQVSMAVAMGQKEMLASITSYFHVGLGRRAARAQLFWGLAVPATTMILYSAIFPQAGMAVLASVFGGGVMLHALMTWVTLRAWWAFQLPAFGFYFFFIPGLIRKAKMAPGLDALADQPVLWLVAGAASLVLVVRYVASRGLRRHLHDTIALGPEAIFRPGQVQAYKQRSRRDGGAAGTRWRTNAVAGFARRAATAARAGDAVASRRWQVLGSTFASNVSPRGWVTPMWGVLLVIMMLVLGYMKMERSLGQVWYNGLVYQAALAPVFGLAMVLLTPPGAHLSRRSGLRAEVQTMVFVFAAALAGAVALKMLSEAAALILPALGGPLGVRSYTPLPLHGILAAALAAPFAWLAVAVAPRFGVTWSNAACIIGFYIHHGVMTHWHSPLAPAVCIGLGVSVAAVSYGLRRRWWLRADLPA